MRNIKSMFEPINVYIFNQQNGCINGINTYIDNMFNCFKDITYFSIHIISLCPDTNMLTMINNKTNTRISIALESKCSRTSNVSEMVLGITKIITDHCRNIFILNQSPCSELISMLKVFYPLSKIIFVIHNQGWCTSFLGQYRAFKSFIFHHDMFQNELSQSILEYFEEERKIYATVDAIVVLSNATRKILIDIYNTQKNKIALIPNGIEEAESPNRTITKAEARNILGLASDIKLGIFVGRMVRSKGFESLLRSLVKLKQQMTNFIFVCIGPIDGVTNYNTDLNQLRDHILFTQLLDKTELSYWYRAADIGVLPSYSEQCSYVALEMMCYNLMIVSSDCIGLKELFSKGNASIAPIGNVNMPETYEDNLKEAIFQTFFLPKEEATRRILRNQKLLKNKYSTSQMREHYFKLFVDVVENN